MKFLGQFILVMMMFFCVPAGVQATPVGAHFNAAQSYELADLCQQVVVYRPLEPALAIGRLDDYRKAPLAYLFEEDADELLLVCRPVGYRAFHGGSTGILLAGQGRQDIKGQQLGFDCEVIFHCPLGWGFDAVELNLMLSPSFVQSKLGIGQDGNSLAWAEYFQAKGFSCRKLQEKGDFPNSKSVWQLSLPEDNDPFYLVCQQSAGSGAGVTILILCYSLETAQAFNAI